MPNKNFFPSVEEFPREAPANTSWNCLMFALGITTPVRTYSSKFFLDPNFNVGDSFLRKVDELKFDFDSSCFRQIRTPMESDGNIFFQVFGFKEVITSYFLGFPVYKDDFHVMRGTRYDPATVEIRWEHKPDWEEAPREVTDADWSYYEDAFGDNYAFFAFTPPKR